MVTVRFAKRCHNPLLFLKTIPGKSVSPHRIVGKYGACIVANPYKGLEEWFEPNKEIIVIDSAEEAIDRYTFLLKNDKERETIGQAARDRVLKQHTFRHRARDLVRIVKKYL